MFIGLLIFFGIHLLPSITGLRQVLVNRLGELPYKGLYALISLTGFTLIIIGKINTVHLPVWDPPAWGVYVTFSIMPLAFILVVAANLPGNIKRYTRHPMLWGITLWSVGHLVSNDDLSSIIIFTCFLLYSLFDMASANRRGAVLSSARVPLSRDILIIIIGIVAYMVVLLVHPPASPILFIDALN